MFNNEMPYKGEWMNTKDYIAANKKTPVAPAKATRVKRKTNIIINFSLDDFEGFGKVVAK